MSSSQQLTPIPPTLSRKPSSFLSPFSTPSLALPPHLTRDTHSSRRPRDDYAPSPVESAPGSDASSLDLEFPIQRRHIYKLSDQNPDGHAHSSSSQSSRNDRSLRISSSSSSSSSNGSHSIVLADQLNSAAANDDDDDDDDEPLAREPLSIITTRLSSDLTTPYTGPMKEAGEMASDSSADAQATSYSAAGPSALSLQDQLRRTLSITGTSTLKGKEREVTIHDLPESTSQPTIGLDQIRHRSERGQFHPSSSLLDYIASVLDCIGL